MNTIEMKRRAALKRKAELKRKERRQNLIIEVIAVVSIIVMYTAFIDWWNGDIPVEYNGEYTTYTVSKGERLWDIADGVSDGRDIREVVHIIEKDNNLNSAELSIGQQLKIRANY